MKYFKKIFFLLTPYERKQAFLLLLMILIMSLLETIGVASILPFMAVLTNPSVVETNFILNTIFQYSSIIGVENNQQFLFALGSIVFFLLVISLSFKALTIYFQIQFVQMREYSIGKRLIEGYLHQPYSWFLSRNSADLGKTILSEVGQVVVAGIGQFIEILAKSMIVISIITLLILTDPKLALMVGLFFGLAYGMIFKLTQKYLTRIGKEREKSNSLRFLTVIEAFGAVKELKIGGLEETYIKRFSDPAENFARNVVSSKIISQLPRFLLEIAAFGGILLLLLYLLANTGSLSASLPIISLYVFAGYRLMPALQQIYSAFSILTFNLPSFEKLYNDIKNLKKDKSIKIPGTLGLDKKIVLKNIFFNYPNTSRTTINNINLNISARTTIGLVGTTGSGKTTIVDIILGLLEPQKGTLEVDSQIISKDNVRAWQRSIGYVPQQIFLADDTIEANIAFGVKSKDIDQLAILNASKIANLHEFVEKELPEKYQTFIGERGIRLSGGQRQRIGIARALYHNPQVLILDEATNALDNNTEKAVMEAVNKLSKNLTIILIAHRLNTVKNCDKIYKLEKGKVVGEGKYDELISDNY